MAEVLFQIGYAIGHSAGHLWILFLENWGNIAGLLFLILCVSLAKKLSLKANRL